MTRISRAALLAAIAGSVTPRVATAYDLSSSSSGARVHWAAGTVTFVPALAPSPDEVDPVAAAAAAAASVATWGAGLPDDAVVFELGAAAPAAPRADDGVNTIRWALDQDDPDVERGVLGRTFAIFRTSTGELRDADIVLDAADFAWTTDLAACANEYDFASALTHELGHAIGLAHSIGHPDATMFATGDACESAKRDLDADDVAALAELYAPRDEGGGGCSTSGAPGGGTLLVLGAALMIARRRRAAPRGPLRASRLAGAAVGVAALAGPATAGTLRRLPLPELAEHAALVVRGRVVATSTTPALETDSTVAVDECLAGPCPAELVVRRHGGTYGDVTLAVDGEAALAAGDEVVLYVRIDARRQARVLGGIQGAWTLTRGVDGVTRAARDLRAHVVRTPDGWRQGAHEVLGLEALRASVDTVNRRRGATR
jgi:MYXO-CTERM domain-containing protein